mgnify:CR=1 FL=1
MAEAYRHHTPHPIDLLLSNGDPLSEEFNPATALRSCWRATQDTLVHHRCGMRALAELSLGEILCESDRLNREPNNELARVFTIHRLILSSAAYLSLANREVSFGLGEGREFEQKALTCIDELLEFSRVNRWDPGKLKKDLYASYSILGRAVLDGYKLLSKRFSKSPQLRRLWSETMKKTLNEISQNAIAGKGVRSSCVLKSLLSSDCQTSQIYRDAFAEISSLPYDVFNLGQLLRSNHREEQGSFAPGAAPLLVAAAFSRILSAKDRIVGVQIEFNKDGSQAVNGDIDLMLYIDRRSKSGLKPGFHVIEIKYQNAFKSFMEFSSREVTKALGQLKKSQDAMARYGIPVFKGIALFDTHRGKAIEIVRNAFVGADLYRVHVVESDRKLSLSERSFRLVSEPNKDITDLIKVLKASK